MAQLVEVAGVGIVEFPDGMSRDDMAAALRQLPTPGVKPVAKPPETFVSQVAPPVEPTKPVATSKNVGGPEDLLSGQNYGDDSGAAYVAPAKKPNPLADSVVSKGLMPVGSSKDAGFLPVKPEVLAAFESRYDAATPKQRKILATQPGWMGDIARSRDKESAERDKIYNRLPATSSVRDRLEDLDPRAEFRKQALVAKGEKPEFAEVAGKKAAAANVPVGREIDFMSAEGLASPSPINEKIAEKFEKANFLERGIEKGRSGMRQQVYGLAKFGAEMVGADEFAGARGLDIEDEAKLQNSIGSNPDYWKNQTENVISSITQQAPTTLLALTGIGTPAAMGIMYVQQFGGAYGESRKLGQDPGEATARAGWMALAEVLGEIPGFGTQLKIMRGALKTAPLESLRQWVVNTAKKEIPGEQFTLAMQTIGDVEGVSPFGTKGMPTIEQYLDQAKDTLVQTVMQSAIMGGGTAAVGKGAQLISGRKPEESQKFKPASEVTPERVEPTFNERPKLTELEAARKPKLEGEAAAAPLTDLEAARKPELEVARPTGPLAQLEGARKEELEQEPPAKVEDPRIAAQTAYYTSQGFGADDAQIMAIHDIEVATGEKVGQPTGRAMQRDDAADEQRTAEGKAERAALSMEETNVPTEIPANVTESIPDKYGYEVPSRDEQAAARLEDPFTRGLDNAADLARRSTGREERERTSLEANQKRIQSQVSQAFNREAYPDLGILLGANWTRKILTTNPTPEEYQDAAYARLEELGGRLPEDAQQAKETPRVTEAPKAVETKEERPQAPAAAPAVETKPEAVWKGVKRTTRGNAEDVPTKSLDNVPQRNKADTTTDAYKKLKASIAKTGIVDPITLARSPQTGALEIFEGNHRLQAARELGIDNVPVVLHERTSPSETTPIYGRTPSSELKAVVKPAEVKETKPAEVKPAKPAAEPAPLEMQRTRKEKLEAETPIPAQPATAVKGFAPLELEAARKEELEVEPPAVVAATKSEAALPKEPKTRKPGGGRKKSELAKTQEQRTKDTNAINQFNRDVITLVGAARKYTPIPEAEQDGSQEQRERGRTGAFPTEKEYDYAEAVRLRSLDLMRKKIYALSLVRDPKAGYIVAKNYIRTLKPAELARAKGLHEGTIEPTKLPPKPEATLTPTQLEKFRKGETETMKPRGRPKKAEAAAIKPVPAFGKQGFRPVMRGGEELMTPEEYEEYLEPKPVYEEPIKSARDYALQLAREAGISEKDLKEAADTAQDISEDELNFDDVQKMSVPELTRITQIAARIVETEHSGDPDLTFTRLTTLSEALEHIAKTGTPLDAGIADALMSGENGKLIAKVKLFTANPNTKYSTPEAGKFWHNEMLGAKGLYAPTNKWKSGSVLLAEPGYGHQGINNRTVLHEATHAATVMKISYVEAMVDAGRADELSPKLVDGYRELSKLMDRAAYAYEEQTRRGFSSPEIEGFIDAEVFTDLKEFAAYGLTEPAMKALLHSMPGVNTKKTGFSNFISGVLKLLNINPKYESGLKDFILATGKLMEAKTPSAKRMDEVWANKNLNKPLISAMKKAKTQESETKRVLANLQAAKDVTQQTGMIGELVNSARDPSNIKTVLEASWSNMSTKALGTWLYTMPTDVIISVGTDAGIGNMKQVYKDIRDVGKYRRRLTAQAEEIARPWIKLNTKERNKLADIMLASTDLKIDPSKNTSNKMLNDMWNALPAGSKKIYSETRDFNRNAFVAFNAMSMERVKQSNLKGDIKDPTTPKGRVAQAIKDLYKQGSAIEPYFQLMREGDYWLSFGKGEKFEFYTFESPKDRVKFISRRIKAATAKGDSRSFADLMEAGQADEGNDIKQLRERAADSAPVLKKIFDSIDKMDDSAMGPDGKGSLKADIFQMHLMSMPEGTYRKQFIHRKNVTGYGHDMLKNFVKSSATIAGQLARAKNAPRIKNGISAAEKSIERMPDKAKLGMFIRELELRAKDILNPPVQDGVVNFIVRHSNQFIFAYTTTSVKTAVNNTFSLATNSVPTLMKHYGAANAIKQMTVMAGTAAVQVGVTKVKPDGSVTYTWPSMGSSKVVRESEDLQEAFKQMEEIGLVKQSQTYEIAMATKGPSSSKPGLAYEMAVRIAGMPFQGTERMIREVTYSAAVQLGLDQGMKLQDAIDKAIEVTDEALYNYEAENMPRFMRYSGVRLAASLKRFPYFTTIFNTRNFLQMIKPLKGQQRKDAAYAFFGNTLMTGFIGAGIGQTFGASVVFGIYGIVQGLLNLINKDYDDPDGILGNLNTRTWFNNVVLPAKFGEIKVAGMTLSEILASGLLSAASGYDVASGLSQGSLWYKDLPTSSGDSSTLENIVDAIGIAPISVGTNLYSGYKDLKEGDDLKAYEKWNPFALTRGASTAYRYSQEGVVAPSLAVTKYPDEFTAMQLFMQGLGFKEAGLAATQNMNYVIARERAAIVEARSELMRIYYKANTKNNLDLADKTQEQMFRFNQMYPGEDLRITGEKYQAYVESQNKKLRESSRGLHMDPKFQQLDPLRDRAIELLEKGAK